MLDDGESILPYFFEKSKGDRIMQYKEIRNLIEKLGNENYEDFIKAIVSFEKGINDMNALDKIYAEYMDGDTKGLLHEDFDYMIDELRENGEIKDVPFVDKEKDNLINIVGNVVGEVEVLNRETKDGKPFTVVNFTVLSKEESGQKVYSNCSAYGNKTDIPKDFKKGDFVKIFGELRRNIDDKGKEHSNVRVLSSKLLKAREQLKTSEKNNGEMEKEIEALKSEIEERKLDHYYADSFYQMDQIAEDLAKMEMNLALLLQKSDKEQSKSAEKLSARNEKTDKPKDSVLGAIQKYKAEDKEKSADTKKLEKQSER